MPDKFMTRLRARCRACGFTLVELMITLAVAAILAMIAVPSFRHLLISTHLSGITNELSGDLQYARTTAVSRQVNVAVAASAGNWQNGWKVEIASASTASPPPPPEILRVHPEVPANYVVTTTKATEVVYRAQGSLNAPTGTTVCFTIYAPDGQNNKPRFLQIQSSGITQPATGTNPDTTACPSPP
jgi:type IV fimbrial biogenesis protein FimT